MEKVRRLRYAKFMWGFSKKRFFVTLGISVGVWVISIVIQFTFTTEVKYGLFIFAKSCELTGYPIAQCISEHNKGLIYLTYFINISFWFWVIHLFWGWFQKRNN